MQLKVPYFQNFTQNFRGVFTSRQLVKGNKDSDLQAPVVLRMDNAMDQKNCYKLDKINKGVANGKSET